MSKRKQKDSSLRDAARRPSHVKRSEGIPVLPAAVLLVLLAVAAVIGVMIATSRGPSASAVNGISCDSTEHVTGTDVHYHAHLSIIYQGNELTVPAQIGIPSDQRCIYWLHTHDTTGVIHVEAPKDKAKNFTLGDFFKVWNMKLSSTQVAYIKLAGDQKLITYVDGKQQPAGFDPSTVKIGSHTQIVLEITPPSLDQPPSYTFPQGL